jgi:hypothetical protein
MSRTPDAFDMQDADEEPAGNAVCRTCGEECTWHHTGTRWALMGEDGRLHTCNVTDDFDDLTKG